MADPDLEHGLDREIQNIALITRVVTHWRAITRSARSEGHAVPSSDADLNFSEPKPFISSEIEPEPSHPENIRPSPPSRTDTFATSVNTRVPRRQETMQDFTETDDNWDDPSNKLWSIYMTAAEKHDTALTESWKVDTDGTLIFSGLFFAIATGFLVESLPMLQQNSGDNTVAILSQISIQLSSMQSGNVTSLKLTVATPFQATTEAVWVNALWIVSPVLALTSALLSTLIQQWSRDYLHAVTHDNVPCDRSRIRSFLHDGVEKFGLQTVVNSMPLLLQLAVFFFFSGLVVYVWPMNVDVYRATLSMIVIVAAIYFIITFLPALYYQCPFRTPISSGLRIVIFHVARLSRAQLKYYRHPEGWRKLSFWRRPAWLSEQAVLRSARTAMETLKRTMVILHPDQPWQSLNQDGTLNIARASHFDPERSTNLGHQALEWTIRSLRENNDVEQLVAAIPDVIISPHNSDIIQRLLVSASHPVVFGHRIRNLMDGCIVPSSLSERRRITRATHFLCLYRLLVSSKALSRAEPFVKYSSYGAASYQPLPLALLAHNVYRLQCDPSPDISWNALCTTTAVGCSISHELLHPEIIHTNYLLDHGYNGRNAYMRSSGVPIGWRGTTLFQLGVLAKLLPVDILRSHCDQYCPTDDILGMMAEVWNGHRIWWGNDRLIEDFQKRLRQHAAVQDGSRHTIVSTFIHHLQVTMLAALFQAIVSKPNFGQEDLQLLQPTIVTLFRCLHASSDDRCAGHVMAFILAPIRFGTLIPDNVLEVLLEAFGNEFLPVDSNFFSKAKDFVQTGQAHYSTTNYIEQRMSQWETEPAVLLGSSPFPLSSPLQTLDFPLHDKTGRLRRDHVTIMDRAHEFVLKFGAEEWLEQNPELPP